MNEKHRDMCKYHNMHTSGICVLHVGVYSISSKNDKEKKLTIKRASRSIRGRAKKTKRMKNLDGRCLKNVRRVWMNA